MRSLPPGSAGLLLSLALALALYVAGNHVLVFFSPTASAGTPPVQVCVGWHDDAVFSWWCTPDYTARSPE